MKLYLSIIGVFLVCYGLTKANSDEDEDEDSSEFGVVDGEFTTNCTCGIANKDAERIVGGEMAKKNEFPMVAVLAIYRQPLCTCTVITQRHLVTAAHCAYMPKTLERILTDIMDVYVGVHEVLGEDAFNSGEIFAVEEFIPHPKYHYKDKEYDIAVIYLDMDITFDFKTVAPACLPLGNEQIVGHHLKVLGWGAIKYRAKQGSPVLMKVNLEAREHSLCQVNYTYYNEMTNVCVYTPSKDTCQGDSGGPLLWRDPDTNRYVLVATTSYGKKCGEQPSVNANVTYFLPFIQECIAKTDSTVRTCAKQIQ